MVLRGKMENFFETEKLSCIRNEMTHLWGTACATLGGSALLFVSPNANSSYYLIGTIGTIVAIVMANSYFVRRNEVLKILKKLEAKK